LFVKKCVTAEQVVQAARKRLQTRHVSCSEA